MFGPMINEANGTILDMPLLAYLPSRNQYAPRTFERPNNRSFSARVKRLNSLLTSLRSESWSQVKKG